MQAARTKSRLSDEARRRFLDSEGPPPFVSDWRNVVMIHYEVEPRILQRDVPFGLDLVDGRAFVTLVLFEMVGLRTWRCPRLGRWVFAPIGTHPFLNVRTYVRVGDESGIYFLAEYLPNRLSVLLGPATFGLPYRFGRVALETMQDEERPLGDRSNRIAGRGFNGCVCAGTPETRFAFRAHGSGDCGCRAAETGTLTEFLMERYTAFTRWMGIDRRFRIWHEPWPQVSIAVEVSDASLLQLTGAWAGSARLANANYSTGVSDVWMGRPQWIRFSTIKHRCRRERRLAECQS